MIMSVKVTYNQPKTKENKMNPIEIVIANSTLHSAVRLQLEENKGLACDKACFSPCPEVAVIAAVRYDYSSGGGVARYSQLHVCYLDEKKVQEWQYVDKYSCHKDRREYMILDIAGVVVKEAEGNVKIRVECVPCKGYSNWFADFTFTKKEATDIPAALSDTDQVAFETWVGAQKEEIKSGIMGTWERNTHTQPSPYGRLPYREPSIKEIRVNASAGVAVIITEEQIDFKGMGNAQIQQKAYLLTWKDQKVTVVEEAHAYEQQGSPTLEPVSISAKEVVIGTPSGLMTTKV